MAHLPPEVASWSAPPMPDVGRRAFVALAHPPSTTAVLKAAFHVRRDALRSPGALDSSARLQGPSTSSCFVPRGRLRLASQSLATRWEAGNRRSSSASTRAAENESAPSGDSPASKPLANEGQRGSRRAGGRGSKRTRAPRGRKPQAAVSQAVDPSCPYSINQAIVRAPNLEELLTIVAEHEDRFNDVNAATAFHGIAKLTRKGNKSAALRDPRVRLLVSKVNDRLPQFSGRCLATVARAHSTLGHRGSGFLRRVSARVLVILEESPAELGESQWSLLLWALAKAGVRPAGFSDRMVPHILSQLGRYSFMSMVQTAWACASLNCHNARLFDTVARAAMDLARWDDVTLHTISNLVWAFAKVDSFPEDLFNRAARSVLLRSDKMNAVDVVHVLWSLARLVSRQVERAISVTARENCELEYMRVIQQRGFEPVISRLSYLAMVLSDDLGPQELPSMFWALGTLRRRDRLLLSALITRSLEVSEKLEPGSIAVICWGLAEVQHHDVRLMDALAERGIQCLCHRRLRKKFLPQTMSMCIRGFGALNHAGSEVSRRFLLMLAELAEQSVGKLSNRALATIAWSLAAVGCLHGPLFEKFRTEVGERSAHRGDATPLSRQELAMFYQVTVALRQEAPWIFLDLPQTADAFQHFTMLYNVGQSQMHGRQYWLEFTTKGLQTQTGFHNEVADIVKGLGLECEIEYCDHYSIDVALVKEKIAIEVDGPAHFALNTLRPLGRTILKWRGLSGLGWSVMSVPFFKWAQLSSREQKTAFVKGHLIKRGVRFREDRLDVAEESQTEEGISEDKAGPPVPVEASDCGSILGDGGDELSCNDYGGESEVGQGAEGQEVNRSDREQKLDVLRYGKGQLSKHQLLLNVAARKVKEKE